LVNVLEYVAILFAWPDDSFGFIIDLFAFRDGFLDQCYFFGYETGAESDG